MRPHAKLLGRHADLTGEIAGLTHQFPLDERLLELYLLALHGAGRPAEALLVYHRAQNRLRHETGSHLNPALRDLHKRMLAEDPSLSAPAPVRGSSGTHSLEMSPQLAASSSMQRDNPDFTGRSTELATLISWLDSDEAKSSVPVVVIYGMAGVGKSTFAVHAAHELRERYPEQIHVRLRANDAAEAPLKTAIALGRLLRKLGVPGSVIPADIEGRAELLRFKLTGRRILILLDDALNESQVLPLLPAVPGCLVLVTTRRRTLILPGMLPLPLQPMPHADAEALFFRTVGARAKSVADQASVSRLVRLCSHVPQRICLAGQQLRIHTAWNVSDLVTAPRLLPRPA